MIDIELLFLAENLFIMLNFSLKIPFIDFHFVSYFFFF